MTDDWWSLIDQKAALKEQFPAKSTVMLERPGSRSDRAAQEHFAEIGAALKARFSTVQQEHDADTLIAEMKERRNKRRLANERADQRKRKAAKDEWLQKMADKGIPTPGMPSLVGGGGA